MNRQFWGYAVLPMLDVINHDEPANRAMYWHDVIHDAVNMYKRDGRLALDVGNTGFGEEALRRSQLGILFYEKHWAIYEGWFWDSYGTTRPFMAVSYTHLRAHETGRNLVCRLLLEKKKKK